MHILRSARLPNRVGIALAVVGFGAVSLPISTADGLRSFSALVSSLSTIANAGHVGVQSAIQNGYASAPALMLGVAVAMALPLLTAASAILRRVSRDAAATRRYRGAPLDSVTHAAIGDDDGGAVAPPAAWTASVELMGGSGGRIAITRDMLRIGREDDNDIRFTNRGIHRYHAAIHREDDADWHITDLSGLDGNGVVVNGQRCGEALLRHGDVFDLGPGRFRFHAETSAMLRVDPNLKVDSELQR